MWLLGVQPFPQDLITPLEAFQIYYMPLRPSAWLCLFLSMGGKCFVGSLATTVNSLGFPHFFLFFIFLVIKNLSPSKGVAFKERYRNPTDILRIAVIPDHRFLWWTCSLCLFLSECPSESVDLERSDSTVVSSALTMRQSGGPSGFSAFSHQPVCLTGPNQSGTLHDVCMCMYTSAVYKHAYMLWYPGVFLWARQGYTHTACLTTFKLSHCNSFQINMWKRLNPCNQHRSYSVQLADRKKIR